MYTLYHIVMAALALEALASTPANDANAVKSTMDMPPPSHQRREDRITLKSGRELTGVKVIRSTPFKLVLEVIPSLEPLEIPTRQVAGITYGEPETIETAETSPPESTEDSTRVLQAVKLSPDLVKKMSESLSEKTIDFTRQDIINPLRSAGIMSDVPITFGKTLENLPVEQRILSLILMEGVSFDDFLRNTVAPKAPWLKIEYRFDSVHFDYQE